MNAINEVRQIQIMGREFKIRSDSDPEYLSEVAAYVDSKIEDISTGQRHVAVQNVVLLAALNMADELFRIREAHEALRENIRAQSRELLTRMAPGR